MLHFFKKDISAIDTVNEIWMIYGNGFTQVFELVLGISKLVIFILKMKNIAIFHRYINKARFDKTPQYMK